MASATAATDVGSPSYGHGFKEVHVALGKRGECGGAHIALEIVA